MSAISQDQTFLPGSPNWKELGTGTGGICTQWMLQSSFSRVCSCLLQHWTKEHCMWLASTCFLKTKQPPLTCHYQLNCVLGPSSANHLLTSPTHIPLTPTLAASLIPVNSPFFGFPWSQTSDSLYCFKSGQDQHPNELFPWTSKDIKVFNIIFSPLPLLSITI